MPDAGEGLTEAEIIDWRVGPGDAVAVNQIICEIEILIYDLEMT